MIDWIKSLFCNHEWVFVRDNEYYLRGKDELPCRSAKVFYCKKCLKSKIINCS